MAYTTIDDPSAHFHTRLYSGNGSTQSITNNANAGNFKPDWLWIKERTSTSNHFLFDSNRGVGKYLHSNSTSSEGNDVHNTSFDSNGFGVGQQNGTNENSQTYVAWQWKANGGTTSSNSNGSITSTVQANTTAGFSIVTYTGTGSTATVGHGLGVVPSMIITKKRSNNSQWAVYTKALGPTGAVFLDTNGAFYVNSIYWNNTNPTNAVWTMNGQDEGNANGQTYVAYCFAEIKGYSKFGSYTGNGSTDGPFIYTGFTPAFIIYKQTNSGNHWFMQDNKRPSIQNVVNSNLYADLSNAEVTSVPSTGLNADFLSNGVKLRGQGAEANTNGGTYFYMAFAEHPFVSSEGVPVTAR